MIQLQKQILTTNENKQHDNKQTIIVYCNKILYAIIDQSRVGHFHQLILTNFLFFQVTQDIFQTDTNVIAN